MQLEGAGQAEGRKPCVRQREQPEQRLGGGDGVCGQPGKLGVRGSIGPEEGGCEGRVRTGVSSTGGSPSS